MGFPPEASEAIPADHRCSGAPRHLRVAARAGDPAAGAPRGWDLGPLPGVGETIKNMISDFVVYHIILYHIMLYNVAPLVFGAGGSRGFRSCGLRAVGVVKGLWELRLPGL